jgi:hypothetical protein
MGDTMATPRPGPGAVIHMTITRNNPSVCVRPRRRCAAVFTVIALLWMAAPAGAALASLSADRIVLAQGTPAVSADEAAALVRQSSGGRILGVRRVDTASGPAYHVKVLLDGGRVRVYVVDAGSGQILR